MQIPKQVKDDLEFYRRVKEQQVGWKQEAQEWYEFAIMSKQWTVTEAEVIEARGQVPLVINRLWPVIRLYKSFLGGKSPSIRTIPMRSDIGKTSASKLSSVFNDIFSWIWYNSDGDQRLDNVIENFLARGLGYFFVKFDPLACDGEGAILIKDLHPDDVYIDLDSRDIDFQDATKQVISRESSVQQVINNLPQHARRIRSAINRYVTMDNTASTELFDNNESISYRDEIYDEDSDKVRVFEVYEKKPVTMYDVINPYLGDYKTLDKDEFELFQEENIEYEYKKKTVRRVFKRLIIGDILIGEEQLPTEYYPIIPVVFQHLGNPFPRSLVSFGKDLQKEINKRRSLMIAHATTGAGTKLIAEQGAFSDKEQAEMDLSRPNAIIEILDIDKFKEIPASALPSSLVQLEQFAKGDLEYVLGAPGASMGVSESAHETFKGLMALDEFSQRNISPASKSVYLSLKRLGKVVIDFIQGYMTDQRMLRIVQPYSNPSEEMKELLINFPIYDDKTGAIKTIENDVTVGRYDIQVIPQSTFQNNQAALFYLMLEYYNAGIVDDIEVYKHINIFDKEGLIQRKSALMQTQNQLQQLIQDNENLIQQLEQISKELKNEKLAHELTKFKKHMNDVKLREKEGQFAINEQLKKAINELKLAEAKVRMGINDGQEKVGSKSS